MESQSDTPRLNPLGSDAICRVPVGEEALFARGDKAPVSTLLAAQPAPGACSAGFRLMYYNPAKHCSYSPIFPSEILQRVVTADSFDDHATTPTHATLELVTSVPGGRHG